MGKSIPNNVFDTDSQYDFHRQIVLTDDGYLVVAIGGSYNPALDPIYNSLANIEASNDNILLDTNQLVLNTNDNATETTLNQLLIDFGLEDFASETTLSGLKIVTDNIDTNISTLLVDFNNEDFAQESTQLNIKNQLDNLTFIGDRLKVETGSTASGGGGEVTFPDAYFDAFNRLRVSNTSQRFDTEFIYDKQDEIMDEVIGGLGTVVHQGNTRDLILKTNGNGLLDNAGMMSYNIPYTPGNSQLIAITGNINELNLSGNVEIFFRSKVSGIVVETVYDQSIWNQNTVLDTNWDKTQILEIDFQSLKVGRIRFYLNRGGIIIPIHHITNDNIYNAGYWQLPTLPLCWRIYNDGVSTYTEMGYGDEENGIGLRWKTPLNSTQQLRAICGTVKSEGGLDLEKVTGYNRTADLGINDIIISNVMIPIISIRPKNLFKTFNNRGLIIPQGLTITSDNPIKLVLIHNPTLTGATWVDVDTTESMVEYDISATSFTNGHILYSDYINTSKNTNTSLSSLIGRAILWDRRSSETGILTIAAIRTTTTNADVLAGIRWKEIR